MWMPDASLWRADALSKWETEQMCLLVRLFVSSTSIGWAFMLWLISFTFVVFQINGCNYVLTFSEDIFLSSKTKIWIRKCFTYWIGFNPILRFCVCGRDVVHFDRNGIYRMAAIRSLIFFVLALSSINLCVAFLCVIIHRRYLCSKL